MALYGGLSVSLLGGGMAQDLDLDTLELFSQFFPLEDLIRTFQLHELSAKDLTILKAAVMQTMAAQIARDQALGDAVRTRFRDVWNLLRPQTAA